MFRFTRFRQHMLALHACTQRGVRCPIARSRRVGDACMMNELYSTSFRTSTWTLSTVIFVLLVWIEMLFVFLYVHTLSIKKKARAQKKKKNSCRLGFLSEKPVCVLFLFYPYSEIFALARSSPNQTLHLIHRALFPVVVVVVVVPQPALTSHVWSQSQSRLPAEVLPHPYTPLRATPTTCPRE